MTKNAQVAVVRAGLILTRPKTVLREVVLASISLKGRFR